MTYETYHVVGRREDVESRVPPGARRLQAGPLSVAAKGIGVFGAIMDLQRDCRKTGFREADGKRPDARLPKLGTRPQGGESKRSADKSRGMRRT